MGLDSYHHQHPNQTRQLRNTAVYSSPMRGFSCSKQASLLLLAQALEQILEPPALPL